MSLNKIRAALEQQLATLNTGGWNQSQSSWENTEYFPQPGTPYQRVHLLPAAPDNSWMGRNYFEQGIMQVTVCYPQNTGPALAMTRAELIRTTFARGTTLSNGGVQTLITGIPRLAPAYVEGDRYCIPVSIPYAAQIIF